MAFRVLRFDVETGEAAVIKAFSHQKEAQIRANRFNAMAKQHTEINFAYIVDEVKDPSIDIPSL